MLNQSKIGLEYGLYFVDIEKETARFLKNKFKLTFNKYDIEVNIDIVNAIEKKFLYKNRKYWDKVYNDDNAAEFVTKPLEYQEALNTYFTLKNFCKDNKQFKLKFFDYKANYSSGGLHINLDNIDLKERTFLIRDISNRPYLNWCFNDPSDNINANSCWVSNSPYDIPYERCNKSCAITYRPEDWSNAGENHIEFRFFDNPQCFEEFKLFIDICLKLRDRAILNKEKQVNIDYKILNIKTKQFNISEKMAWRLTLNFIEKELKLKIPIKVKKIWRNRLKMRYQYGDSHLK